MHYHTLKALIPRRRCPALVGNLSPGGEFLGRCTTNFEGKHLKSGQPISLKSYESSLNFLLSDISVRQFTDDDGKPAHIIAAVGIPVRETVGCLFTDAKDAFETEFFYALVTIWRDDAKSGVTCQVAVSHDASLLALHIYKSRDEIAELVKLITAGSRVTVSAEVECWSTETRTYLPVPHNAALGGQVLVYCRPGVPSPQFSTEDIDLFIANEGSDTEGNLAEPSGDIYGELRSINRQLASFGHQLGQLWWVAIVLVAVIAASGVFSRWPG